MSIQSNKIIIGISLLIFFICCVDGNGENFLLETKVIRCRVKNENKITIASPNIIFTLDKHVTSLQQKKITGKNGEKEIPTDTKNKNQACLTIEEARPKGGEIEEASSLDNRRSTTKERGNRRSASNGWAIKPTGGIKSDIAELMELINSKISENLINKKISEINTKNSSVSISVKTLASPTDPKGTESISKKDLKKISEILKINNVPISITLTDNKKILLKHIKSCSTDDIVLDTMDGTICFNITEGLLKMNNVNITVENGKLLWNGNDTPPADSDIELLGTPQLSLRKDQSAILKMVSDLQYFRKKRNGSFELQKMPLDNSPGMLLSAKVIPISGSKKLKLDFKLKINVLKERIKISGVNLNVGEPVIISDNIIKTIETKLATWSFICGYSITNVVNKKRDELYILLKVSREK